MKFDQYGQPYCTESDLVDLLYQQPSVNIRDFVVDCPDRYNQSVKELHLDWPLLSKYVANTQPLAEFDQQQQSEWFMPEEYKHLDIAKWLLDLCKSQDELQRVGEELLLFQERNLFPLLCYLKYLVDTMRDHNIVWGLGRGSRVASYVLFLIGVHKINSMYFDLDIQEFLKG